jgi:GNAT superfamily N-acetyltransferase
MAYVNGGKHFGQYTYEHWFDHEYGDKNGVIIDYLKMKEIDFVSNMITNIFDEFVGRDYSEEGNNTFKDYIKPENILNRLNGASSLFYVAKYENKIIGMLEIKNNDHISLFFIKKDFHGKGIGKRLFKHYLDIIKNINLEVT